MRDLRHTAIRMEDSFPVAHDFVHLWDCTYMIDLQVEAGRMTTVEFEKKQQEAQLESGVGDNEVGC